VAFTTQPSWDPIWFENISTSFKTVVDHLLALNIHENLPSSGRDGKCRLFRLFLLPKTCDTSLERCANQIMRWIWREVA
jgi:hypothetical protein